MFALLLMLLDALQYPVTCVSQVVGHMPLVSDLSAEDAQESLCYQDRLPRQFQISYRTGSAESQILVHFVLFFQNRLSLPESSPNHEPYKQVNII